MPRSVPFLQHGFLKCCSDLFLPPLLPLLRDSFHSQVLFKWGNSSLLICLTVGCSWSQNIDRGCAVGRSEMTKIKHEKAQPWSNSLYGNYKHCGASTFIWKDNRPVISFKKTECKRRCVCLWKLLGAVTPSCTTAPLKIMLVYKVSVRGLVHVRRLLKRLRSSRPISQYISARARTHAQTLSISVLHSAVNRQQTSNDTSRPILCFLVLRWMCLLCIVSH